MQPINVADSSLPVAATTSASVVLELIDSVSLELLFFVVAIAIALAFRRLRKFSAVAPQRSFGKLPKKTQHGTVQRGGRPPAGEARGSPTNGTNDADAKTAMTLDEFINRTISARLQTTVAIGYYSDLKLTGRYLQIGECLAKSGSAHSAIDFFGAMVQCAGRAGRPQLVVDIIDDAATAGCKCPLTVYESAMKLLAGKRCFKEAIDVYDRLEQDGLEPSPVTFSCLVGFAAELGDEDRAIAYFHKLNARDVPSIRAYMTILRVYSLRKDWETSKNLLGDMYQRGADVDSLALNMVLSTGVAAMKVDAANEMLGEEPWPPLADVVSYNIILKGLAQQGETTKALALLDVMRQRNVTGNHITYNTAIDAAVRGHRVLDAWTLYGDMRDLAGLSPDKCTASTMVKVLQLDPTRDRVEAIASLLQATVASCPADLAGRLFANTLQVAVRLKDLPQAMRIFGTMQRIRSEPPGTCNAATFIDLAVLAARTGDAASCATLWKHALPDVADLRAAKTSVTQELANGGDICAVTLRCLEKKREQTYAPKAAALRRRPETADARR